MGRLLDENDVVDALEKVASFFPYRIPGKGETYDKYNEAWNDAIGRAEMEIEQLPSAQPDLIAKIQNGINATNANDSYSCGMRNGMRWCMSLVDDEEPLFENCPSAQPEEIGYEQCANAMMKMWIDEVVTDGEYNRIMDKLNKHWRGEQDEID